MLEEAIGSARKLAGKTVDPHDQILREFRVAELLLQAEQGEEAAKLYEKALPRTGSETWLEREILGRVSAIFRRKDDLAGLRGWMDRQVKDHPLRLALLKLQASLAAETGNSAFGAETMLPQKDASDSTSAPTIQEPGNVKHPHHENDL